MCYDLPAQAQRFAVRKPHHLDHHGASAGAEMLEPLAQPKNGIEKHGQLGKEALVT